MFYPNAATPEIYPYCHPLSYTTLFRSAGGPVDLLLTDIEMPGRLNGLELARLFHKAHPILPIVVTSGHVQPEAAEALGTFIPKPYDPELVAHAVAEALQLSRRDREE